MFNSLHPQDRSQVSVTSILGDPMLSSDLRGHVAHTGTTLRHIIKMKIKEVFLFNF